MARKKRGGPPADEGAGAPAWVMTFADLMSLLMCFFVLLLSFSELDAAKYKQVAGSMKFAFGVQREIKTLESPRGVSIIAKEFSPGKPQPTLEKVLRQKTTDDNRAYMELLRRGEVEKLLDEGVVGGPETSKSAGKSDADGKGEGDQPDKGKGEGQGKDQGEGGDEPASINGMLASLDAGEAEGAGEDGPQPDAGEGEDAASGKADKDGEDAEPGTLSSVQAARIQATMLNIALEEEIDEGLLEVETLDDGVLVRVREQGSFPSGTADMAQAFLPVLNKIASALVSEESKLVVSGHTDNRPIATARYPSNWMLSAARATSVVEALAQRTQVSRDRLEVRAHADTVPVDANDTAVGRARNRRVEIFIGTPTGSVPATPGTAGTTTPERTT